MHTQAQHITLEQAHNALFEMPERVFKVVWQLELREFPFLMTPPYTIPPYNLSPSPLPRLVVPNGCSGNYNGPD